MKENEILLDTTRQNEKAANITIRRVMVGITFGYFFVWLLSMFGVFKLNTMYFNIEVFASIGAFGLCIGLCYLFKGEGSWLKYLYFIVMTVSFVWANIIIGYFAWILLGLDVVLSSRYYNKKFTLNVGLMAALGAILQAFTNTYLSGIIGTIDLNMISYAEAGTLPYEKWLGTAVIEYGYNKKEVLFNSLKMMTLPNLMGILFITFGCHGIISSAQKLLVEEMMNAELEKNQLSVMNALTRDFLNVYIIDTKYGTGYTIKLDGYVSTELAYGMKQHKSFDYNETISAYISQVVIPEDVEMVREQFKMENILKNLVDKPEYTGTYRIYSEKIATKSGVHYVQYKFTKLEGTTQLLLSYQLVDNIVEAEREKTEALEKSQNKLQETLDIVSTAGLGVWTVTLKDGEKPRIEANEKMLELLGIEIKLSGEEIYEFWYERIHPDSVASIRKCFEEMKSGRFSEITYQWNHPVKGMIYCRTGGTKKPLSDGTLYLTGYHAEVTDIVLEENRQKQALAEALDAAQHANRAKTVFLNNMSHDIRTPMNAIIGFTEIASTHAEDAEAVKGYLGKISVASQHLLSLINDVLDMSRIESGRMVLSEEEIHLPDVLADLKTITQASVAEKHLSLSIDTRNVIHEDFMSDPLRLKQVLLNIIGNAVKFTPDGGEIHVRVTEIPGEYQELATYEFKIRDNGLGMSKEFQSHIFESFSREKNTTISRIEGTGLGMSIVKNIVDMMKGTIAVDSTLGKGSEFTVTLPLKISGKRDTASLPEELKGQKVLVVDDDLESSRTLEGMLSRLGMFCDRSTSFRDAMELLKKSTAYYAYVIDGSMTRESPLDFVHKIRSVTKTKNPLVVFTGFDVLENEKEAREAGVDAFLSKPLFLSSLKKILASPYEEKKEEEKPDFSSKRILLVEDNELNREIAETILKENGLSVETAEDGSFAVEMMKNHEAGYFDLILMDIQMPVMNGYVASRTIRALPDEKKAGIPILAMTANAFEEDKRLAFEAGMDGHIAKPIDVEILLKELARFL